MEYKKIAVFGCKSNTKFLIEELNNFVRVDFLITIPRDIAERNKVADYLDICAWAGNKGITVYIANSYGLNDKSDQQAIAAMGIDIAFVNGWQRLLPPEVLDVISIGAFGMHGSAMDLPKGRGRSPMNWSILEGRKYFYTNIFKYDVGVDSGGVLGTLKFQLLETDTAETLHFKNSLAMITLIRSNWEKLQTGNFKLVPQKVFCSPTYYPKRSPRHNQIDFGADIVGIERLIRAVAPPFGGAYAYLGENHKVTILRASIFDINDFYFDEACEGTIVMVWPAGKFLIKCLGGLLLVHEYESSVEIQAGLRFSPVDKDPIEYFERNKYGHFDLEENE